jgi:hypothetical protein
MDCFYLSGEKNVEERRTYQYKAALDDPLFFGSISNKKYNHLQVLPYSAGKHSGET